MGYFFAQICELFLYFLDTLYINISGADNLVLDMKGVKFMDSSGIGMIIGRYKTVSALGGTLSIACPSKEADRILSISGIYRIINSYGTVEDAILGINQEVHSNER